MPALSVTTTDTDAWGALPDGRAVEVTERVAIPETRTGAGVLMGDAFSEGMVSVAHGSDGIKSVWLFDATERWH